MSEHTLTAELDMWKEWWSNQSDIPETAQSTLRIMDPDLFPNMYVMMKLLCTLLVNVKDQCQL